ncbi:MAG: potassium/proton antiporter [Bacteroidales bacterium]|nr:potassium/proton antiporter [Candidatus Colimorpha pelethequi]
MQIEFLLLIISILFFASIIVSKASSRFGVPVLLLFLAVGMIFGVDGFGIQFDSIRVAQVIGTVALCIILFSGGMDTKLSDVKPIIGPGVMLATIGVFITAFVTGFVIWIIMDKTSIGTNIGLLCSLLLAATISSTDSASVFSILRSKGLHLKNNLKPTLELESGSNDPMAYVLTITLISLANQGGSPQYLTAVMNLFIQLIVGAVAGYCLGKALVWLINRLKIENESLYPILVLSSCIFIFAVTYYMQGNSYLAVYIGGLIFGNSKFVHKRSTRNFFDGISWLSQLVMFLTLGLLVNPSELNFHYIILPSLIISAVMILLSRPLAVFISLLPFKRYRFRDRVFVSWCGLRGAVPIIFAILCRAENVPHADTIFNIVFCCTLVSLVLQGTTLPLMARWLKVEDEAPKQNKIENFDIDFPEEIKSATSEIEMTPQILSHGNLLMDLRMPEKTLAIMVKRGENYFVPTGKTHLMVGDKLMVITDNNEALEQTLKQLSDN